MDFVKKFKILIGHHFLLTLFFLFLNFFYLYNQHCLPLLASHSTFFFLFAVHFGKIYVWIFFSLNIFQTFHSVPSFSKRKKNNNKKKKKNLLPVLEKSKSFSFKYKRCSCHATHPMNGLHMRQYKVFTLQAGNNP